MNEFMKTTNNYFWLIYLLIGFFLGLSFTVLNANNTFGTNNTNMVTRSVYTETVYVNGQSYIVFSNSSGSDIEVIKK